MRSPPVWLMSKHSIRRGGSSSSSACCSASSRRVLAEALANRASSAVSALVRAIFSQRARSPRGRATIRTRRPARSPSTSSRTAASGGSTLTRISAGTGRSR